MENHFYLSVLLRTFSSDDESLSLACPRESNQREGHPNDLSLRDSRNKFNR